MSGTWVKLDDTFPDHPKVLAVGDEAAWLYVAGLCHCSRHLTDGFIATAVLGRLTGLQGPVKLAGLLVDHGLWDVVDGGWLVHDYTKHQRSRERIESEREAARDRAARSREVRAKSRRDMTARSGEVTEPVSVTVTDNPPVVPPVRLAVDNSPIVLPGSGVLTPVEYGEFPTDEQRAEGLAVLRSIPRTTKPREEAS